MKKILLVDDDQPLLAGMAEYFIDFKDEYEVRTAINGREAVKILKSTPIDLVVTDLKMPDMDGIELLAYMSRRFPHIPAIVLSAYDSPIVKERLEQIGSFQLLPKPCVFENLNHAIVDELKHITQEGHVKDISAGSFLQLIEMEDKTCFLEVEGEDGRSGFFYFNKGDLRHAALGDLRGERAAIEMISWEKVQVHFRGLPRKVIEKTIHSGVMSLILESSRFKNARKEKEELVLSRQPDLIPAAIPAAVPSAPPESPAAGPVAAPAAAPIAPPEKPVSGPVAVAAADTVESPESPAPGPDQVKPHVFEEKLKKYADFDGFLGIGIFDALGAPAAMHTTGEVDLLNAGRGALIVEITLRAMRATRKAGADPARMVYMETEKAHAFIAMVKKKGEEGASDPEEMRYYIIFLASLSARIGLVKKKFEIAVGDINDELKNQGLAIFW
ncbi:MAG: response regulator [Desulfobacterales bacterium]|nr:response regulator [Desulfobacterales bacterium]